MGRWIGGRSVSRTADRSQKWLKVKFDGNSFTRCKINLVKTGLKIINIGKRGCFLLTDIVYRFFLAQIFGSKSLRRNEIAEISISKSSKIIQGVLTGFPFGQPSHPHTVDQVYTQQSGYTLIKKYQNSGSSLKLYQFSKTKETPKTSKTTGPSPIITKNLQRPGHVTHIQALLIELN